MEANQSYNNRPFEGAKDFFQYTMHDGLTIGLLFLAQAGALLLYRLGILSSILLLTAIVAVPIVLYQKGVKYRENILGGTARYMQVVSYLSWAYLFAIIIAFVSFFFSAYLLFRDTSFIAMMEESMILIEELAANSGVDYGEMIENMRNITPLSVATTVAFHALFNGLIYIYIICIFIKRSSKK